MASAVSADGSHLSSASRAAATSSAAASGSLSIRARRAASACRQAIQCGAVASAKASPASSSRARKRGRRPRGRSRARQAPAARPSRSPGGDIGTAGPGVHASLHSRGRSGRTGRVCRSARQLPPGGALAPTRPHYPRRMPETPPTRFAYLGPEGTFAEAALITRSCLLGGSPVPPAECRRGPGRRPFGGRRRRAGPAGELRRGFGARHDGRAGRRRPPGDHPRGLPPGRRSTLAVRPGTALADVRSVASHPHALAQTAGRLAELPARGRRRCPRRRPPRRPPAVAAGEYDAAVCAPIAAERYGLAPLVGRHRRPRRARSPGSCWSARRARCRRRPATTRPRWSPSSATAPARCWSCSASSPSAGSR